MRQPALFADSFYIFRFIFCGWLWHFDKFEVQGDFAFFYKQQFLQAPLLIL